MTSPAALHSSGSDNWFTPAHVIEAATKCLGKIDLDPASCYEANMTVGALYYYNREQDGLTQQWGGNVFLNPPGGSLIPTKAQRELLKPEVIEHDRIVSEYYKTRSRAVAWWRKLSDEYREGRVNQAIFLGFSLEIMQSAQGDPLRPSPLKWPICVPEKRLKFSGAAAPSHSNVIVGMGVDKELFRNCFKSIGEIKL